MNKSLTHQVIALAGLTQAVALVQQIAKHGSADRHDMSVCIASTLKVDSSDVLDVYGGLAGLSSGLKQLVRQLSEPRQVDPELARYAATLIFLQEQLMRKQDMVQAIGVAITRATSRADAAGTVLDDAVFEELAEGYKRTLSTLKPRVMISGESMYLSDVHCAGQIRALLLAGVRSALLWRQCGGVRWQLLLRRSKIQREALRLIATIEDAA
ncbi:MAG: high frequency lysogenization protein HflD [Methylococcaceae bacterium]|jgi:high frequency lysogenization protein